jgi:hypothetical protein
MHDKNFHGEKMFCSAKDMGQLIPGSGSRLKRKEITTEKILIFFVKNLNKLAPRPT